MPTRTNRRERVTKRRQEATKRAETRAKRSNAQQIALLQTRPGKSEKEISRLSNG